MDSLAHSSHPSCLPHPAMHSPLVVYPPSSDSGQAENHLKSSAAATSTADMNQYYLPLNGSHTSYPRLTPSFSTTLPSAYLPPYSHSSDPASRQISQEPPSIDYPPRQYRPSSSSSEEPDQLPRHGRGILYSRSQDFSSQHPYGGAPLSCPSTASSDNELYPLKPAPSNGIPNLKTDSSLHDPRQLALPPITSNPSIGTIYPTEGSQYGDQGHSPGESVKDRFGEEEEQVKDEIEIENVALSTHNRASSCKVPTAKKSSNVKVSEKRRQQNRAAQRAMRERRKRAAQHQEVHMSAILTENALLREKVTYLSNLLLAHAIAPGSHLHPWNAVLSQDQPPPMITPLNAANHATRPTTSDSTTPTVSSSPGHSMLQVTSVPGGQLSFPASTMSYYSQSPYEYDYIHQAGRVVGVRSLSGAPSTCNFSRPATAEDGTVDGPNQAMYPRWHNASPNDSSGFGRSDTPMTKRPSQFGLVPSISTDCCSINTASTLPSPTQTDGHLIDTVSSAL